VPGDVLEDVALVDLHGVGDLRQEDRLPLRLFQELNDPVRLLDQADRQRLVERGIEVVIGFVTAPPQFVQLAPSRFQVWVPTVGETQDEVGVSPGLRAGW
jgi:hypothetical protein